MSNSKHVNWIPEVREQFSAIEKQSERLDPAGKKYAKSTSTLIATVMDFLVIQEQKNVENGKRITELEKELKRLASAN